MMKRTDKPLFSTERQVDGDHRPNPYRCPRCGADYPSPGTCYGRDKERHEPQKVGRR